jgi:hypothetical protein
MERGRMAVTNGLLACRGLVNRFKGQRDFNQFFSHAFNAKGQRIKGSKKKKGSGGFSL